MRTRGLLDALRIDPSAEWTLEEWASRLDMSRRTLIRACETELGVSFGQLRRLMQVRRAVEYLAVGRTVSEASQAVGYAHVPKFISMFRRLTGTTPARYFRQSAIHGNP